MAVVASAREIQVQRMARLSPQVKLHSAEGQKDKNTCSYPVDQPDSRKTQAGKRGKARQALRVFSA